MREILFRGKHTDNGKWVEGLLITVELDTYSEVEKAKYTHCIVEPKAEMYRGELCGFNFVKPETVGQYTGLTDKNGKRIFEGDIVTGLFLFGLSVKAVVTFQDGAFGLEWYRGETKTFDAFTSICNVDYEVIGNIHDSPELLK